jgi:hypothetical protein
MQNIISALANYVTETRHLDSQPTSTENTFYPAIKALISAVLKERRLPFEVRVNTSETKSKARDLPDFVLGDDKMFVGVYGEVKRANVLLEDLALSTDCGGGFKTGQKRATILENTCLNNSSKAATCRPLFRGCEKTRVMVSLFRQCGDI